MRIVAGQYKGRRLNPGKMEFARPTTDFAREGLCNVLNNMIDWNKLTILDLYAGTGAMSLEFLSRGAASCVAVDNQASSVRFISKLRQDWGVQNLEVIKSEVLTYLDRCAAGFDLIFADPPYMLDQLNEVHNLVMEGSLLNEGGLLIMEHDGRKDLSNLYGFSNKRTFGKVNFSIFSTS